MGSKSREVAIVSVSLWDTLSIHCLSFVFGLWVLVKRIIKWFWDPNGLSRLQARDNPPACLVDSSLGQHKYVKLKHVKLHYVESGSKENPLLLLLHGFPDCWLSWRHQIPLLSPYFRVIALDLKGFGDSDKPQWRSAYKIDLVVDELKQLVHALGAKSCTVVGHDLGALLGWYLVHLEPSIVERFVAVSCPHPNIYLKNLAASSNYGWVNFVQLPYLPEIDALKEDVSIISEYHKHLPQSNTYLEAYKYTFSRKEDWTGPINYYRNLPFKKVQEDPENQLETPILLVVGNEDRYVQLGSVVKSTEYCDKFHMRIIDGAGHFPHQENPHEFNKILLKHVVKQNSKAEKTPLSKGIMDRMFTAVSSTMKYGNSVLGSVQKRTNGVVSNIPTINYFTQGNGNEVKAIVT